MAARKKSPSKAGPPPSALLAWADVLGEVMGRAMARGFADALRQQGTVAGLFGPKKRGRPMIPQLVPVPPEKRCTVPDCPKPARSKGLCAAHYQAERRKAPQRPAK